MADLGAARALYDDQQIRNVKSKQIRAAISIVGIMSIVLAFQARGHRVFRGEVEVEENGYGSHAEAKHTAPQTMRLHSF